MTRSEEAEAIQAMRADIAKALDIARAGMPLAKQLGVGADRAEIVDGFEDLLRAIDRFAKSPHPQPALSLHVLGKGDDDPQAHASPAPTLLSDMRRAADAYSADRRRH